MKQIWIFDSTPLIYLGKVRILEKLKEMKSDNIIPYSVFIEVVQKGKDNGIEDAFYIDKLINQKVFRVVKVEEKECIKRLAENPNLEPADIDVLSIAKKLNGKAIMDDEEARTAADVENIDKGGSIYLLFKLLKSKTITKKECREVVDNIIYMGWRCSTEMYAYIIKELEKA